MGFKSARIKSGKKVTEVMEYMGVTDSAVYQWEMRLTSPRIDKLPKLAEFYGCTVDELLAPEEVPDDAED